MYLFSQCQRVLYVSFSFISIFPHNHIFKDFSYGLYVKLYFVKTDIKVKKKIARERL